MPDPTPLPEADDEPQGAASDPPLSLAGQSPGPSGGLGGKIGLAGLALAIMFALVVAIWAAGHYAPKAPGQRPPAEVTKPR